ncbi:MAG: hypothetical protein H7318_14420 [Oligoflexus sp.]|nr:hypothetical protein [Oligoflexus sp.]
MPSKLLGPDFEDFTITYENLRWLHSCRWEGSHAEVFAELRGSFTNSYGKAPNLVKSKNHPSPAVSARWLLIDEEELPIAWAELQSFPSQRDRPGILLWGRAPTGELEATGLSRLISFCFIVGKFDHIKVGASAQDEAGVLSTFAESVGEKRQTMGLAAHPWYPNRTPFKPILTLELARDEWMKSTIAQDPSKTLKHIQSRIERFEKTQTFLAPKRKKRGLLARIINPKIDDSLF